MSERYDPYKRYGEIWIPQTVEQEVFTERATKEVAEHFTRQQKRRQEQLERKERRKKLGIPFIPGVSK